ncbi:MAG TPA: mechanosensitive ion channel domain-containing protein [Pseudolabrys sp.]|nr:mechanosensitive ion channel domain-containing protein [Pseudolabrys sp.]
MNTLRSTLTTVTAWLAWLPNPVVAIMIVLLAVAIAYSLHRNVRRLLRMMLANRYPYALSVFTQMRSVTRLALVILAMIIAIPVAPFDPDTADWLARLLLIAVIILIGWAAITALRIGADLYLLRFRIDTDDNLLARKHFTQVRLLLRTAEVLVVIVTIGACLMTFEPVRQYGVSLFASAGVAGIVAGLAARPVLSNLFAGVQLAMTQPIRLDDQVVVENEWGWIEEITATYVVVRLWDWRRLIVPLTYFIEKPFQNWTRESASLIGTSFIYVDYRAPVGIIRDKLNEIVKASKLWDGKVVSLQVTEAKERTIELRCLMSASSAGNAFDLRCEVREKLIDFLQREHPEALPTQRAEIGFDEAAGSEKDLPRLRDRADSGKAESQEKTRAKAETTGRS